MEIEEEEEEQVEIVYVAVGKEYKESKETLLWVVQNISKNKKVVLVHVHRPAQMIPMMGAKFSVNRLTEEQVSGYRQLERQKMNKTLDEYLVLCSHAKVQAERLVIEMDDVGKGLVELIARHGITKFVMGAAADRQYSKKMKAPKSKIAISVQQRADQSCKIWFVCKGNLICTRNTVIDGSEVAEASVARLNSSKSHQLRGEQMAVLALKTSVDTSKPASISSADGSVIDLWEGITKSFQESNRSTSICQEALSSITSLPVPKDKESEKGSMMLPSVNGSEKLQFSPTSLELEDNVMDGEVHEKLQRALKEEEDSRREAYKESCRRRKAESNAIEAARKVKASENSYANELEQRKNIEIMLAREGHELEELKIQHYELMDELKKENEKKVQMKLQIDSYDQIIKDFQVKLLAAKRLLGSLQKKHEELQHEQEKLLREAEKLRQKREEATTNTQGVMNFTEFTYSELEGATNNFDDSMKIGEGGYGCVYKGFLRHTMVAVKILNPESKQGQTEFYQEVEILSQVRHPHLVTLIGTCPEVWALIYEYLPQGSLEDRLVCKHNTPPLPWYTRTRISAEICSALIFLHSNKPHTIVHGDIKPANILLDSKFKSKLGDFGICRLLVQSSNTTTPHKHTNPKGTLAYMDPEFVSSGELTSRSDVYSFGVIILRLLTGRPAIGLIKEVKEAMKVDRLHEMLDVSAGDWPFVQAKQLGHLALRCCEIRRKNRPNLAKEAWRVFESLTIANSSMGSALGNSYTPSYFICPIFQEIMTDPHIAADGFTYEGEALKGWLDSGHDTSPMTNIKFSHHDLVPNHALRSAIHEWLDNHK